MKRITIAKELVALAEEVLVGTHPDKLYMEIFTDPKRKLDEITEKEMSSDFDLEWFEATLKSYLRKYNGMRRYEMVMEHFKGGQPKFKYLGGHENSHRYVWKNKNGQKVEVKTRGASNVVWVGVEGENIKKIK